MVGGFILDTNDLNYVFSHSFCLKNQLKNSTNTSQKKQAPGDIFYPLLLGPMNLLKSLSGSYCWAKAETVTAVINAFFPQNFVFCLKFRT